MARKRYSDEDILRLLREIELHLASGKDAAPEFDLRGHRYQQNLEARVASLLGKEEALLFPTCTMANQTALAVQCHPGHFRKFGVRQIMRVVQMAASVT